ncbi:glycosylated lysosomal membrane protein-like [Aricia agestis]|uniref:glycosylated lysosomal membrane protein-like n=1 Tax=Aricia agestis TaxID=91739 RepID=UPI001C20A44C|nr:glycosylated lysosomal membrane protein-like [Aricia agestis]XP_041980925.1 glycosylated lysosomal membrane protein-like [Aricia agestis]
MCKIFGIVFMLICLAYGQDRKVTSGLNPGCAACNADTIVAYVRCEGPADTIHQIWDFSNHAPTFILALTSVNSTLNITWDGSSIRSFNFTENPKYSFAASMDKFIEYNDTDSNCKVNTSYPWKEYSFDMVSWTLNDSKFDSKEAMIVVSGKIHDRRFRNATIHLKTQYLPWTDAAEELPRLVHTANSSLVDIRLARLPTSYPAARYALRLALVSTDDVADTMRLERRKSLDDEHTPGVFEIDEILSPALHGRGAGGYVQFRPVGYTQPRRTVASSTLVHVADFDRISIPRHSTLRLFYGAAFDAVLAQTALVTFGDSGDGFYAKSNYTDWSWSLGCGAVPAESLSLAAVVVLAAGAGGAALLAVGGGAALLLRRRTHTRLH